MPADRRLQIAGVVCCGGSQRDPLGDYPCVQGGYAVLSGLSAPESLPCGPDECDGTLLAVDLGAMVVLLAVLVVAGHRYLPRADRGVWFVLLAGTVLMLGRCEGCAWSSP